MFQGKFNVQLDPYTREHIVHRFHLSSSQSFDHRFIPLPPAGDRVSVDDFEQRILSRIEEGWDGQPIPGVRTEKLQQISAGVIR